MQETTPFHIEYIAKRVIEQKGERVYTYSRERIKWHKEMGHKVIAISGSPIELVREVANKYGMDDFRGTVYETGENGRYNGSIIPMWDSQSKQKALHQLAEIHNVDLSLSYAYGDTSGDFSMLRLVGKPHAINPTRELLSRIKEDAELRSKIKIIVERKDVTYQLDVDNVLLVE